MGSEQTRIDGQQFGVDGAGPGNVASRERLCHLLETVPHDVTHHRHHPRRPEHEHRQVQDVITAVPRQVRASHRPLRGIEITLRVLVCHHTRVLGNTHEGFRLDGDTGSLGDVVRQKRQVRGVGDRMEVGDQAFLRGSVVVRGNGHDSMRTGCGRSFGARDGM